ncbi:Sugar transporter [Fusarium torreyae]|uniref:Sugar transporter n=1 Tax=Fusarium torreyae TaxID=1237075 RepID=A0A9W8RV69_9HYPO|nr:Sugar transporter [Fusarium torreyae]
MSDLQNPVSVLPTKEKDAEKDAPSPDNVSCHAASHLGTVHELSNITDPVLSAKTHLVNEAINEIGWTTFHFKLSCLTGFGFAADSLVAFLQSVAASQAYLEIGNGGYPTGSTIALYAGLQMGALFWGFGADIIGRRIAFNTTLFIAAIATVVAGAGPNWVVFCVFVALLGFGAGGNLVLDPTVMLEFVPAKQQWIITAMAGWWGIGQASAGFIAWGYYSRNDWTCDATIGTCTWQNNKSWRLIMFTGGSLMFIMSVMRIFIIRLPETPKFLVASGRDEELVSMLQNLAATYSRPCSLTVQSLQACGSTRIPDQGEQRHSAMFDLGRTLLGHVKGLFATRKLALSTCLIWISWTLIGLGYPLFFLYLPSLISSRVPDYQPSFTDTWRDYTITNICSIFGPLIAAGLAEVRILGRRYTMAIGAVITAIFFFAYTVIKTPAQNLAISSCISVCINLYYGTLYAYTAEVFPSAHRATGNGIAVSLNRIMGLLSAVIAVTADTATVTPLYISAALFLVLAVVSIILPFEPYGRSAS